MGFQMDYILDFDSVDKGSLSLVGGKNASLGEMIKAGFLLDIVGGLITIALALFLWPYLI